MTAPTSSPPSTERWRPEVVLAWGEPYASPLWEGRRDGLAYVCRDYACEAPQDSDGLRAQLTVPLTPRTRDAVRSAP